MPEQNDLRYGRCVRQWDDVFSSEGDAAPAAPVSSNAAYDEALKWLCAGTESVLDFGCGNGVALIWCALLGTKRHMGIDLSGGAIASARKRSAHTPQGEFVFQQGGAERLASLPDGSFDAVILSNILDNLYPDDALSTLANAARLLKSGGRALVKLNPYLSPDQIREWNIRVVEGDLLDDGLLLWNLPTERWRELLEEHFTVERFADVYYPEHEQTNRLFLAVKPQRCSQDDLCAVCSPKQQTGVLGSSYTEK